MPHPGGSLERHALNNQLYPFLLDRFALRQVGQEILYLMDSDSGDYYELEPSQFQALRLSDGSRSMVEVAGNIGFPVDQVVSFFEEQQEEGIVQLVSEPTTRMQPHFRYSEPPHLSDVLIEITGRCNLACAHCFNSDFNSDSAFDREMNSEQLQRLISELDDLNVRRIQISGGEPLLRDDIWATVAAISRHRMFLDVISTNATLVDEVMADRFARRFSVNGALYVSMDGLTAPSYEALRGTSSFSRFDRALHLLDEAGCRMFINTMAVRPNLDEMDAMYDWMAAHPSVHGWRIGLPKVLGRYVEHHKRLELEFVEVIRVFARLLRRWMSERPNFRLELSDFFRTDSLETGLEDHRPEDNPCKYALTNLTIKPDGNALFCASLEIHEPAVFGNVLEEGLASVWYGSRHMSFRKIRIVDLPHCCSCRYTRLCGGGCRSNALLSYGDIYAPDPRACVAMQFLEKECLGYLPREFRDEVEAMIDMSIVFESPTGYRRYI